MATGLGAILVAEGSAFVKLIHLPSLSEASVATFGVMLVMLGVIKRLWSQPVPIAADDLVEARTIEVDLPSLTGQLSGLLTQLRQQHGVVYRSRTWIESVLPDAGAQIKDLALARDLLAAAALDAGGLRADVSGLAATHSREHLVATSSALLEALQKLLAACDGSMGEQVLRPSDPSCWPASAC